MGFKITHPLLPSRLLVWPLWHTSAWRQHVLPDRMSGTSDTAKWPQCLHFHFVLVALLISRVHRLPHFFPPPVVVVSRWMSHPHLFSPFVFSAGRQINSTSLSAVCFSFSAFFRFVSVFECHYTCGRWGYHSRGVFCLSPHWIDLATSERTRSADW